MKKFVFSIIFLFTSFFIFSFDAYAGSFNSYVNLYSFDFEQSKPLNGNVEIFNYFDEKINNTNFYNFLYDTGSDILTFLETSTGRSHYNDRKHFMFIYNSSEFNFVTSDCSLNIPSSLEYDHVIRVVSFSSLIPDISLSSSNVLLTDFDNFLSGSSVNNYYYFLNGSEIVYSVDFGYYNICKSLSSYNFNFSWKGNTYLGSNFALLLSKFYYTDVDFVSFPYDVNLNVKLACLSDNKCYGLTESDDYLRKHNLDYYIDFPFLSRKYGFRPLLNTLNYYNDLRFKNVPSNFLSTSFSLSNNVILFPKKSCDLKGYRLFLYSSMSKDVYMYLHSINTDDTFGYLASYYSYYQTQAKVLYNINPLYYLKEVSDSKTSINLSDDNFIKYYYRFSAKDNKANYILYYNPECYSISENYEEVVIKNPLTGNDVTFTGNSSDTNWKDPENINSSNSVNFWDKDVDVSNVVGGLKKNSGSIITAATEIVSLSTSLFHELPSEVTSFLLVSFFIVITIGLIKILKDIL